MTVHDDSSRHTAAGSAPCGGAGTQPNAVGGRRTRLLPLGLLLVFVAQGCARIAPLPDLHGLYTAAAQRHEPWRNPIIVIPGILGSRLRDAETKRVVWGAFVGDYADPRTAEGARLIALPMGLGLPLSELRDGVEPDGALDRLRLSIFGLPYGADAYVNILASLGVGGYRDETLGRSGAIDYGTGHFTCFQFDYDWRRDLAENARRLERFVQEKRAWVQAEYLRRTGTPATDVHFDIVAHSMGGLLARYFLRYGGRDLPADGSSPKATWEGARYVDRAILVGTPNAGSLDALFELVEGDKLGLFIPRYPPAVLGTMPAVYELLPRGRHGVLVDATNPEHAYEDLYDPALWQQMRWGLADPTQDGVLAQLLPTVRDPGERYLIALDHQRKCLERARALARALDEPAVLPAGLQLDLIAGDATPTPAVAAVHPETGRLQVLRHAPGDGTVLRSSALLDERVGHDWAPRVRSPIPWTQVFFLFTDHMGLTRDPAFIDNVLYLLLEAPRNGRTPSG